tara:strand:+ start:138 stop:374 length:237 start_codon:yes stop_codon:yes gene_type:complete
VNQKNNNGGAWLKTPDAVIALGISRDTLRRRRLEGFFVYGQHFLKTSPGRSGWYLWNIDEVQKVLGTWKAPQVSGVAK